MFVIGKKAQVILVFGLTMFPIFLAILKFFIIRRLFCLLLVIFSAQLQVVYGSSMFILYKGTAFSTMLFSIVRLYFPISIILSIVIEPHHGTISILH